MPADVAEMEKYLRAGKLMTLCTTDGGRLHACSVWFSVDMENPAVLYFTSRDSRAHSVNIRQNGLVSGSIVHIALEGLGQKTKGVFFSGRAYETSGPDIERAYTSYSSRWPQVRDMFGTDDIRTGATPMRMYAVKVAEWTFVDEAANPSDPIARVNVS